MDEISVTRKQEEEIPYPLDEKDPGDDLPDFKEQQPEKQKSGSGFRPLLWDGRK